jgi:thiamine biosynthesis lipoprotein ApbE
MSRLRIAFGTFVAVEAEAPDAASAARAIAGAFAAVSRVERLMHPTRAESDLARLAASPPGRRLQLDAWTWQVLELCQRLHRSSRGIFDPCLHTAGGRLPDVILLDDHGA